MIPLMVVGVVLGLALGDDERTRDDCSCARAKLENGWCDACDVGYVAAMKIESAMLFEALDAHGHDIDPQSIKCRWCTTAVESDGFCDSCSRGFVKRRLYFSKLTWLLAGGKPQKRSAIACQQCRQNSESSGWCKPCRTGMVGNVALQDEKKFRQAKQEYQLLLKAVRKSATCESCAVAMFTGARCPICKISYKRGGKTKTGKP